MRHNGNLLEAIRSTLAMICSTNLAPPNVHRCLNKVPSKSNQGNDIVFPLLCYACVNLIDMSSTIHWIYCNNLSQFSNPWYIIAIIYTWISGCTITTELEYNLHALVSPRILYEAQTNTPHGLMYARINAQKILISLRSSQTNIHYYWINFFIFRFLFFTFFRSFEDN